MNLFSLHANNIYFLCKQWLLVLSIFFHFVFLSQSVLLHVSVMICIHFMRLPCMFTGIACLAVSFISTDATTQSKACTRPAFSLVT